MRVLAAAVVGGLAVSLAVLQAVALIAALRRKRSYSFVPFVGAGLWIVACVVAPWSQSWYTIPLFLVIDPTPVMLAITAMKGRFSK